MKAVRNWISGYPELQKRAVLEALESCSLAKVRRALRLLEEIKADQSGPVFDVELLSTFNLEPVRPVLELILNCLPRRARLHLAPLDAIETHLARSRGAADGAPSARLIIWRAEELLPEALFPFSNGFPNEIEARLDQVLNRIEGVVRLHQANDPGVPLFLSTLALPGNFSNPLFAAQHRAGLFAALGRVNQKIYGVATDSGVIYVLDLAAWAAGEGKPHASPALDFMARQPLSASGQIGFAHFVTRCLRPLIAPSRKALAIDLDNTLWGGVLGEDGVNGLQIGHEFPGNVHRRIQRELLELRARGIALVLLSKNDERDVREAFDSLPDMLLKWDDFAVQKVDWNAKHGNLRAAAQELGLGTESFAFLDDSDYEREQMRQFMPEVLILNENSDALQTLGALWETDAFDSLVVSKEDRHRQHDFNARGARDAGAHQDDLEAFLKSLEMEATIETVGPQNIDRVVTMLGKTNQFNLTTRRHSRAEVEHLIRMPGSIALVLRLRDKFGDQGIIALLLAIPAAEYDTKTLLIDSFLVSCRALGRGVENALWAAMLESAHRQGIEKLEAEYRPTPKNSMVADFYPRLGLQCIGQNGAGTGYLLQPVEPSPFPLWIAVDGRE